MNDRLHPLLLLLTVCDLAFVSATGAVSPTLTLPLWGLALAAPRLRRLQRYPLYRVAWNACVLVTFGLLLHHAVQTGLLHMLEDGLVLSVLCQVHLLNNLGDKQRPDLIFFNSFLIAFVTSFFAPDVWWSLLFVAHTLLFVPALQLHVLSRRGCAASAARAVLRDSLPRVAAISVLTAALFLLWPRDFERVGWMQQNLDLGDPLQAGLVDRIDPGRRGAAELSDAVQLRVTPENGALATVPTHWRARAFVAFDGQAWTPQRRGPLAARGGSDPAWQQQRGGSWRRAARGDVHATLRVQQYDRSSARLALPLASATLRPDGFRGVVLQPQPEGGLAAFEAAGAPQGPLTYRVGLAQPQPRPSARLDVRFRSLPSDATPALAADLGRQLRASLPEDVDDLAFALAACSWLQTNRRYQLPGGPGFAANLDEFLLGTAPGHCEYFATALALVLRCERVPCRLIGGYPVHEPSADGAAMIARSRDAHAWVEVLAADGSWHTFDPTPAADLRATSEDGGFWRETERWLEAAWARVTGFDEDARSSLLRAALHFPLRHPLGCAGALAAAGAAACLLRRRRARGPAAVVALQRALRRARLRLRAGETPRELLHRATASGREPRVLEALRAAVTAHERARYRP